MADTKYTDEQYKDATQIAYLSYLRKTNKSLRTNESLVPKNGDHYTIEELTRASFDVEKAYAAREKALGPNAELEDPIDELKSLVTYSDLSKKDKSTLLNISNDSYQWKYLTSRDTNSTTGFYGCALEMSNNGSEKGDLMIAFRGSENMFSSIKNDWHDWILADLGLLNKTTLQHKETERFAQDLIDMGLIDDYSDKEIHVSGHSLGGNLASYFTIYSAEHQKTIFNKIKCCYNEDGPGFTREFFKEHEPYSSIASSKIVHLKASFVGNLLFSHPNEDVRYVKINHKEIDNIEGEPADWIPPILKQILRHDSHNWTFDENGSLLLQEEDEPDELGRLFGTLSNLVDITNTESIVYALGVLAFMWIIDEGEDGAPEVNKGRVAIMLGILAAITMVSFKINPIGTGVFIALIVFVAGMFALEQFELFDDIDRIIQGIIGEFKEVSHKMASVLEKVWREFIDQVKNGSLLVKTVNFGTSYAANNPIIQLDTNKLRDCANRLERVNQRLSNLDGRVKALYYTVGLKDILNILNADWNSGYNNTLKRCSNYLAETANDFEQVEKNIESVF